jgi:hypothetical protein
MKTQPLFFRLNFLFSIPAPGHPTREKKKLSENLGASASRAGSRNLQLFLEILPSLFAEKWVVKYKVEALEKKKSDRFLPDCVESLR